MHVSFIYMFVLLAHKWVIFCQEMQILHMKFMCTTLVDANLCAIIITLLETLQ